MDYENNVPKGKPMRILIADDHEVVRRGVQALLDTTPGYVVCGEAADGKEAIAKARDLKPDIVLIDLSMPHVNGLEATTEITRSQPGTKVLILSQHDSGDMLRLAITAGARGYLVKSSMSEELLGAITRVAQGDWYLDARMPDAENRSQSYREILERSAALERELRESEARFRSVMYSMAEGVLTLDRDGVATYMNPAAERMLGWTSGEVKGRPLEKVVRGEESGSKMRESWAGVVEQGQELREREDTFYRRDETTFPVVYNVTPLKRDEEITGMVVGFRDDSTRQQEMELRTARTELSRRESQFKTLMDALPAMVWIAGDPECNVIVGNRAADEFLRVEPQTNVSQSAVERGLAKALPQYPIDGGDVPLRPEEMPMQKAVASGQAVMKQEVEFRFEDGTKAIAVGNAAPFFDEAGAVRGAIGAFIDITDLKETERELRESKERFQAIADNIPPMAWMADEQGKLFWTNLRWQKFAGKTLEEMDEGGEWEELHHPEHRERVRKKFLEAVEKGEAWEDTFPMRRCDGEYRWFLSRAVPVRNAQGRIEKWFGTNTDITEHRGAMEALRDSEARFARLVNSNIIPILCAKGEQISEANDAFLALVGYTREDLKEGRLDWVKMTPSEYAEADQAAIAQGRREGFFSSFEKEYFHKDGRRIPILVGGVALCTEPWESLCFVVDLTDLKRTNEELQRAHEELEARVEGRTRELANAMAALRLEVQVRAATEERLRELSARVMRVQDEERRRIARELHDSAGQTLAALKMMVGKLGRSLPEAENLPVMGELRELADEALREIRTTSHLLHPPLLDEVGLESALRWLTKGYAERSNVDVTLHVDGEIGRLPNEYELCLFRTVQECLTNIHRHSGSKTAAVRLERAPERVRLQVVDQGKGMPAEVHRKIASGENPGVGLRGMRERIGHLGGSVMIESSEQGTVVTVVLPLTQEMNGLPPETTELRRAQAM